LTAKRDAAALDKVALQNTGAPAYRWNELLVDEALKRNMNVLMANRLEGKVVRQLPIYADGYAAKVSPLYQVQMLIEPLAHQAARIPHGALRFEQPDAIRPPAQ
jgi:hypothetical protein